METEESLIYLFCYVVIWITLFYLGKNSERKYTLLIINLSLQVGYTIYFVYNLKYNASGGMMLVWGIYWLATLVVHCLLNILYLLINSLKVLNRSSQ